MTHNDVLGLSGINRMDEGNNGGGYSRGPPVRGFHFIFSSLAPIRDVFVRAL